MMLSGTTRALLLAAARRTAPRPAPGSAFAPAFAKRAFSHVHVVSGPPRTRISLAEKMAHGIVQVIGYLFIPVWVLTNLKHYRGELEE